MYVFLYVSLCVSDRASIDVYCLRCCSIVVLVWLASACCPLLCVILVFVMCAKHFVAFYCYLCLVLC